jgi:Zn-dependent protease
MHDLLSPLTRDGHQALTNARRIAGQHNQPVIDSEMLLLGLLHLSGSQAEDVLRSLRLNPEKLTARLSASIKLQARQQQAQTEAEFSRGKIALSADAVAILREALAEAQQHGLDFVDTRLLALGILRCPDSKAGQILAQYGLTLDQFRAQANLKEVPVTNLPRFRMPNLSLDSLYFGVSPIFIGLALFTALSGYLTYAHIGNSQATMFFFVTGGWIISVALHEFGHALIAYWGGDDSVVDNGYLTLNPLKYTHPFLSIFMPVLFLMMGGIGLPGGAVYINPLAIRSDNIRSLVAAAGPIATTLCAALLGLPFIFEWYSYETIFTHFEFWAGVAFLAFLQITGVFINLLPIPGLDGFGIAQPFLPPEIAYRANLIRPFGFFILYALLFIDTPVRDLFWEEVWKITVWISPDLAWLASEGLALFRFWQ